MHRPLVIGHATAAGEAPANTLAGVRAALAAPCDAMEIDVQLSADGVPVLLHDETLDRTTDRSGPVRNYTASELSAVDAGAGEHVPTLDQVLELVAGQLAVFCELKATTSDSVQDARLADAVGATAASHEAFTWSAVQSFNPLIIERAREVQPRLSTAIISPPVHGEAAGRLLSAAIKRGCQAVSVHHSCVDAALVRAARLRQLTLWTWTPDDEAEWHRLADVGVDGIITNYPSRLRVALET